MQLQNEKFRGQSDGCGRLPGKGIVQRCDQPILLCSFYAIKALLALEEVDFKKHKDVVAYFNRTYAATEKIPREIGRKLARLQQKREKSDYDDFYIASKEETMEQIENSKSVILAVKDYLSRMEN